MSITATLYRPVTIDCLLPGIFPQVALFMRAGSGNYTLYKPEEMPFTQRDSERLANNGTRYLHVRDGDFAEVSLYLEQNLGVFLANSDIAPAAKNLILQQVSIDFVAETLSNPDSVEMRRCRSLMAHLFSHISSTGSLMDLLGGLAASSSYFLSHSVQVASLSMLMHERLYKVDRDEMVEIGVGGILHDIGLTFLAGNIGENPDALSEIEWRKSQLHPTIGHEFLAKIDGVGPLSLEIVRHHHERWDGTGYPDRLKGNNISRSAQIAAACDIYSSLTNNRAHRKASTNEEALRMLGDDVNGYFSPEIYAALAGIVRGEGA